MLPCHKIGQDVLFKKPFSRAGDWLFNHFTTLMALTPAPFQVKTMFSVWHLALLDWDLDTTFFCVCYVQHEPEREKVIQTEEGGREKWSPVAGLWERRWGGDEIPPYLSRQLHFADFYLGWQRGMWGSLHLAFNWLSICQTFSPIPLFKAPREVWEYWLPLPPNVKSDSKLNAEAPLLPSPILYLQVYTGALNQEYLKIDPTHNNSVSITGHLMYNLQGTACDRGATPAAVGWRRREDLGRSLLIFHSLLISQGVIPLSSPRPCFWPMWNKQLNELKGLI